jgi:Pentapeptide repeats (9 copies)
MSQNTSFIRVAFSGTAYFQRAAFSGTIYFDSATFTGGAHFRSAAFSGPAYFESAAFAGFRSAAFSDSANFENTAFSGPAYFRSAAFSAGAYFHSAAFSGNASFERAAFSGTADFQSAAFSGNASLERASFSGYANLRSAAFSSNADFQSTTFSRNGFFSKVQFRRNANFYALRGERGFDMAGAVFEAVPDFIQAHFEEAPRLDNMRVVGRMIAQHPQPEREETESRWLKRWRAARYAGGGLRSWTGRAARGAWHRMRHADANIPSRWRALKRLAIQGHDTDRELEFHAREVRSQRFADDWPLPLVFWRGKAWGGFFRFWFGIFYQIASDFGRSILRPLLLWGIAIVVAASFYFSQADAVQTGLKLENASVFSSISGSAVFAIHNKVPCYRAEIPKDTTGTVVAGISDKVAANTSARAEALQLAFRNAFIILDGGADAAHRTYGCLYGVEMYAGSNPIAVVPGAVSTASAIQKGLSGVMIFLFGLVLRNMLKMK